VVQLSQIPDARGHETTRIKQHDNVLIPLDLVLLGHQSPASRGRLPGYEPQLIPFDVISKTLELFALTEHAGPS
jgi:hypothetical protein